MSKPQSLFFDTGILIALFNKSEKHISEAALKHINNFPHASRHVVSASLVELFYKLRKSVSPLDVQKNLDHLGITLFPLSPAQEGEILRAYCQINHKSEFDYADYFICRAAILFSTSQILTIDRDDLPLALSRAYEHTQARSQVHLLPF